jgi:hypothetical protein
MSSKKPKKKKDLQRISIFLEPKDVETLKDFAALFKITQSDLVAFVVKLIREIEEFYDLIDDLIFDNKGYTKNPHTHLAAQSKQKFAEQIQQIRKIYAARKNKQS